MKVKKYFKFKYLVSIIKTLCYMAKFRSSIYINFPYFYLGKNTELRSINKGKLVFGTKTYLDNGVLVSSNEGVVSIGNNNYFNTNCKIVSKEKIEIGDNNLFGPNVLIYDHDHGYSNTNLPICKNEFSKKAIKLGNDIWIGGNSIICKGVTICDRVIVGANSVVTHNILESGLYAGSPAKFIKSLD